MRILPIRLQDFVLQTSGCWLCQTTCQVSSMSRLSVGGLITILAVLPVVGRSRQAAVTMETMAYSSPGGRGSRPRSVSSIQRGGQTCAGRHFLHGGAGAVEQEPRGPTSNGSLRRTVSRWCPSSIGSRRRLPFKQCRRCEDSRALGACECRSARSRWHPDRLVGTSAGTAISLRIAALSPKRHVRRRRQI